MEVPEESRFHRNAIVMSQAIHEAISNLYNAGHRSIDPNMVAIAGAIIQQTDPKVLIEGFITNSHKECWEFIKNRNEKFFIENAGNIFLHLPMDKVSLFKDLFLAKDSQGRPIVQESLKDQLWRLFDAMVKISIKYVHKNRSPAMKANGNKVYTKNFFNEVDLQNHIASWGIVCEFPRE